MHTFSNPNISIANQSHVMAIVQLLNSAYRGESSKKGWTTEAHLIAGDVRADEATVSEVLHQPKSVFLIYQLENQLTGCVNLQQHDKRIYLGMFSVSPEAQGGGIGKQLLLVAEEYASSLQCNSIYMTVISARQELIDWYKRYGYVDTGIRKPFVEDGLTGKHLQPLEFMVLEKTLTNQSTAV